MTPQEEPAVPLSRRQWDRIIERLENCKEGWTALWIAAAFSFFGVMAAAVIAVETIPTSSTSHLSGETEVLLWVIAAFSFFVFLVCLVAYLMARKSKGDSIDSVVTDMKLHEPTNAEPGTLAD